MSRVSVIATIDVEAGAFENFKLRAIEHRARCLSTEPGTLMFELMLPRDETNRVYLYEVYRDQAAFDTHWNGESIAQFRRDAQGWKITGATWGTPAA